MTDTFTRQEFANAINLLDACEEALDLAARTEASEYRGMPFRQTTHQSRAAHIKKFVAKHSAFIRDEMSDDIQW